MVSHHQYWLVLNISFSIVVRILRESSFIAFRCSPRIPSSPGAFFSFSAFIDFATSSKSISGPSGSRNSSVMSRVSSLYLCFYIISLSGIYAVLSEKENAIFVFNAPTVSSLISEYICVFSVFLSSFPALQSLRIYCYNTVLLPLYISFFRSQELISAFYYWSSVVFSSAPVSY